MNRFVGETLRYFMGEVGDKEYWSGFDARLDRSLMRYLDRIVPLVDKARKNYLKIGLIGSLAIALIAAGCNLITESDDDRFEPIVTIDPSAKDRVEDPQALNELVNVLGEMVQARRKNEITFISKRISLEEYLEVHEKVFGSGRDDGEYFYNYITKNNDPAGGLHASFDDSERIIVVVDTLSGDEIYRSAEFSLITAISGELAHSRPYEGKIGECEESDTRDWPIAYGISIGATDKAAGKIRDPKSILMVLRCANGKTVEISTEPEYYEAGYKKEGLFGLAQKALNSKNWPEAKIK